MPDVPDDLPVLTFADDAAFEAWIAEHHATAPGLWVRIGKKSNPEPSVTYAGALDVCLCWGWIDGQRRSWDEEWFVQRYTPRRPRGNWSRRNVEYVARLEAAGRMRPEGRAEVDAAKADGRWERAYDGSAANAVPPELAAALDAEPGLREQFDALDKPTKFHYVFRIQTAKRAETRERHAEACVEMLREAAAEAEQAD